MLPAISHDPSSLCKASGSVRAFIRAEITDDRFQDVCVGDNALEVTVLVVDECHMDWRCLYDIHHVKRIGSVGNIQLSSYVQAFAAQTGVEQILRLNDAEHLFRRAGVDGQSRMNTF
jgi:hypothetical protein